MYLILLLSYLSSIHSFAAGANDVINCVVPPDYKLDSNINLREPQETVTGAAIDQSNTLDISCSYGYGLVGPDTLTCYENGTFSASLEDIECVPYCKVESNKVVMSCGNESRCVLPPNKPLFKQQRLDSNPGQPVLQQYEACGRIGTPDRGEVTRSKRYVAGGTKAQREEMPWHAGIYVKMTDPYLQICGGSLVSSTVVISAAHCFWSELGTQLPISDYVVAVGKLYRPWNDKMDNIYAQKSDVADIRIPQYFHGSATNLQDDIALVVVTSPFRFNMLVRPVCLDFEVSLDRKQLAAGKLGKVAGWGLTSADGRPSPVLQVAHLPVVDAKQCFEESDPTFHAYLTSDKICAGFINGTAVCKGDSGGGLVFYEQTRYYLRGIVSGAPRSDHLCNTLSWASFTHVLRHENFIRETVQMIPASML